MITTCPNCSKELRFTESQENKIQAALDSLKSGTLKIKCPHCRDAIELQSDGSLADWRVDSAEPTTSRKSPEAPKPPNIDWLTQGKFEEETRIRDMPKALILIDKGPLRDKVNGSFVELFYQTINVDSVAEAIEQMRTAEFVVVVLHSGFDGVSLKDSEFHEYMRNMQMFKRRYIFYVLIGSEFKTLYTLEALSYSANLVINDGDVDFMKNIYKRGRGDYDELFGPYMETLKKHGRK
ncbi:MAG: zinc-ribbon domain-containing protein [Proteobacteria bacterium]|nr:zinc-ribbon domain-containing protein [Pseudomonadota bacterium]MBU1737582.1 zinc-ribbon domain-containing protein [Pseudomonadota bacterium]